MSNFIDTLISQGTRKKIEYDDAQRSRLVLNIGRTDGGTLQIPILVDAKSTQEEETYQHNTLLAITPLARLPGHDKLHETLQGALPRPGRIYVFLKNQLWRELETDGQGQLFDVDVAHWRRIASQQGDADAREPVGVKQLLILVPMLLQGRFVGDQLNIAYSERPWTWEYIEWLEQAPERIKARCQSMVSAWTATLVDKTTWKASSVHPATQVQSIVNGLRPRDFNVESALEDPAAFTPDFAAFTTDMLIVQLQQAKEELASKLNHPPPTALPSVEAAPDLLAQSRLREHPHLVAMIVDDPLFMLRHATAQVRDCADYLQTLNALVPHEPYGRYAQVLYSTLAGPLADLADNVDLPKLHTTVFEDAREKYREKLAQRLATLVEVLDKKLHPVLLDWSHCHDEALLEPYALLTEALNALNQLPHRSDALYVGLRYAGLNGSINRLVHSLLQGEHPMGALLLAKNAEQPPQLIKRLQTLHASGREPKPEAMGLSTLMLMAPLTGDVDYPGAGKGFAYFSADLLDNFGASVVAQIGRLSQEASAIELDRLFTPTFTTLAALSPKMAGIRLMPMDEALDKDYVIIGVEGEGLRSGLTDRERQALTRKSYRYATLHEASGKTVASTSPRGLGAGRAELRNVTVIAVPRGSEQLAHYSDFRVRFGAMTQAMEKTRVVPTLMVGFAVYNLWVQIKAYSEFKAISERNRGIVGVISAGADLMAALGSHSKLLFGPTIEHQLIRPRFNVAKISTRWANNLELQTGSPKLPLLRAAGGIATLIGATLSGWDSYRSVEKGDTDAAAAYGVAAIGGALWAAAAVGLIIVPYVLLVGVTLTIGGTIVANLLTDSDLEIVLKKGPFGHQFAEAGPVDQVTGNSERFAHLRNPHVAWQQLLGILGKPQISIERLSQWCKTAPPAHVKALQQANSQRKLLPDGGSSCVAPKNQALIEDDWVVVLSSPLLAMFENDQYFQMRAQEFISSLRTDGLADVKRYKRVPAAQAKIGFALDATSVLYVLPTSLNVAPRTLVERHRLQMTHGLRVYTQFELGAEAGEGLMLPQPDPRRWSALTPGDRRRPPDDHPADKATPYWQIAITEFPV